MFNPHTFQVIVEASIAESKVTSYTNQLSFVDTKWGSRTQKEDGNNADEARRVVLNQKEEAEVRLKVRNRTNAN